MSFSRSSFVSAGGEVGVGAGIVSVLSIVGDSVIYLFYQIQIKAILPRKIFFFTNQGLGARTIK